MLGPIEDNLEIMRPEQSKGRMQESPLTNKKELKL
jgi:hypothetical protein